MEREKLKVEAQSTGIAQWSIGPCGKRLRLMLHFFLPGAIFFLTCDMCLMTKMGDVLNRTAIRDL